MKKTVLSVLSILITLATAAQDNQLETFYEKSGCVATPSYDETVAYCQALDKASPFILYTTFGTSPQGRKLPLLILDADGRFDPISARKAGKLVLMVIAGNHPGEADGKDAGFMLFRDMVIHQQFGGMPENLTILFIPIFNVDGHERFGPYNRINQVGPEEMGWRTTAQNLNLNRDFLKADTPEMQAWLKLYSRWLPDFMMDIHVTNGADYQYVMTYGLETHGNMDEGLTRWTVDRFIPEMESQMESAGYPSFPYVMFRRWHDPRSGLRSGAAGPRYSQGYAAAHNRIGLLVENHSLKDFETRVSSTYELLRIVCRYLQEEAPALIELNELADLNTASATFRQEPLPMSFTSGKDSIMIDFRGVEYDAVTSDLTGGTWFKYYPDKPKTFQVPLFYQQIPSNFIKLPEAYIYPPEWSFITERLDWHGIRYSILEKPERIMVQSFIFRDYSWSRRPYEGRFSLTTAWDTIYEERLYPAGSVLVKTDQRSARLIAHMFEPASPDSYLSWGFFNTIFEMKEYFETYKMEEYARKMMADNPGLLEEFKAWVAENPEVQNNQWGQLEWFYRRSPYWDRQKDVYPVGKIGR
jgi:hypothetical protein